MIAGADPERRGGGEVGEGRRQRTWNKGERRRKGGEREGEDGWER